MNRWRTRLCKSGESRRRPAFVSSRGQTAIAGLEIAGMMRPARGVGGDYYDYIPIDAHTIQLVVADVAGKGVSAALLMSATAAAMQLEANHDRDMLEQ